MADFNDNYTGNGQPEAPQDPDQNRPVDSTPECPQEECPQEEPEQARPADFNAERPREAQPPQDPYRTTGSNAQPGWQQMPPPGGQYSQYNPRTGWSGAPNYSGNYRTGGGPQGPHAAPGAQGPQGQYGWNFTEYETVDKAGKKGKKKHRGLLVFTGIICTLFAVTVVGFAGFGIYQLARGTGGTPESTAPLVSSADPTTPELSLREVPRTDDVIAADGRLTPTQIATKVRPSVVGIVAYVPTTGSLYDFGNSLAQSEGSGIIMSADGYIITNAHVVSGATGIKVVLNNDEEYDAQLIGSDTATDLAVIKVEADNLTPAEFGDSGNLEVGEYVAAIGNPGGLLLSNSMTQGIVSGINRSLNATDGSYTMNYIQTDAAINPGNSGGALVNEYGQVIGINSVKIAQTEYEGLGFAIPISDAKPIVDDLIAHGKVTGRVRLGIEGRDIDEVTARYNSVPAGFQVLRIDAGSDIASQGVVAGDIITKVDDTTITSSGDIREYLRTFKPGDKVTLTVFRRTSGRQDTTFEATVTLVEDDGDTSTAITPQTAE